MNETPRVLITGAGGFVGRRLVAAIRRDMPEAEVLPAARSLADGEARLAINMTDLPELEATIRGAQPTAVIHLAAVSAVTDAHADPRRAWDVNATGTLNLVLALERAAPDCRLLHVSTAEVYGRSAFSGEPVREDALLQPANPYAASKAAADLVVREAAGRSLRAVILRPFNHTGPGQSEKFVVPAFCSQVARIEKGLQPPQIEVGELSEERDFLDVDDVVDLYVRALKSGDALPSGQILNAASGRPWRIGDILSHILSLSTHEIRVHVDEARKRPSRVPRIVGDASSARDMLGWEPQRPFEATIAATLDYWRKRV